MFRLYVNGQFIGEAPYEEFFGDCFGFQVWSGTESIVVDFDNLSIKTY